MAVVQRTYFCFLFNQIMVKKSTYLFLAKMFRIYIRLNIQNADCFQHMDMTDIFIFFYMPFAMIQKVFMY